MNIFQILSIEYFIKTVLVEVKKDKKIMLLVGIEQETAVQRSFHLQTI